MKPALTELAWIVFFVDDVFVVYYLHVLLKCIRCSVHIYVVKNRSQECLFLFCLVEIDTREVFFGDSILNESVLFV